MQYVSGQLLHRVHTVGSGNCMTRYDELRGVLLCRRLVEACPKLEELYINFDTKTSMAVMNGLQKAKLGGNNGNVSDARRTILLKVSSR